MGYLSYYCFDYQKCAKRAQNEGDYHACQDGFYRWASKYVDLERNDHEYSPGRSSLTAFRDWAFSIEDLLWDNLLTFADHA